MKIKKMICFVTTLVLTFSFAQFNVHKVNAKTDNQEPRQMEKLDRGLVAVKTNDGVFLSWRLLGTEDYDIPFDVYRDGVKITDTPITNSTNYLDKNGKDDSKYYVTAVTSDKDNSKSQTVGVMQNNYLPINLDKPKTQDIMAAPSSTDKTTAPAVAVKASDYEYTANDVSVGDVDGDGEYELIVKWDPSNSQDNSKDGYTGDVYLDAYKLNGKHLWRIDLGKNIRAGAHYTQFMVYDFDGDGRAEVACKTADGTIDGEGNVIGDKDADYRNDKGRILDGPEYLTVFDGLTGKALDTVDYEPARGKVSDWGDNYGNRCDRFLACVAYLDGVHPSLVMCRGYYTRLTLVAYDFKDNKLTKRWMFDSNDKGNEAYAGQGNHNLSVGDVDGDGKDEIIYGSCAIDDDGTGLYSTGIGHGDAMHFGDLDPERPGLEVFCVHEDIPCEELHDAATGEVLWRKNRTKDVGRGMSADIDPNHEGEEMWSPVDNNLNDCKGNVISNKRPSTFNFAIWWDGDLCRELLDGTTIYKWDYNNDELKTIFTADGCASNNSTKANPCLQADLFGDWREEVVYRTTDSTQLRIYTTTDLTDKRIYTLMHDPVYRLGVAWQNVAYNQPPHTSYFLGNNMGEVKKPNIYVK